MMKPTAKLFLSLLLCCTILSCNKGKETEGNFGQEFPSTEVNKAIISTLEKLNPNNMKKDTSVTHIVNLRVENSERFRPMMWDHSVVQARTDTPTELTYHIATEEHDLSVDPIEIKKFEEALVFKKTATKALTSMPHMYGELANIGQHGVKTKAKDPADEVTKVKYFNMKSYPLTLDAPEEVKKRPDCAGLKDCKYNVDHIEFNEVIWYKDGRVSNVRWTYEISPDVPHIAAWMTACASQLIDYEGSKVYVRNCSYVVDFNF